MSKKRTLTDEDFVAGGYGEFLGDKEWSEKKFREAAAVREAKAPPLNVEEVEGQLGWWLALQRGDVRLFEAWLAMHGAIVIADRTVAANDVFFEKLAARRSVRVEEHAAGFVYRRRA